MTERIVPFPQDSMPVMRSSSTGELFDLVPIPAAVTPESPVWHYRDSAQDYLGAYPNLGNGAWALIVRQRDGVLCDIGGNCLGWALGNYGLLDPPDQVWGLARQYLDSVGPIGARAPVSVGELHAGGEERSIRGGSHLGLLHGHAVSSRAD
jgi:hypothetical protein